MSEEKNVVIDLSSRRPDPEAYDGLVCDCGSAWFKVEAVAFNSEHGARIGGFSGIPVCVSCGAEVLPNQPQWVAADRASERTKLIALLKSQYGVPNDGTIFERLADVILDAGWRHVES